MRSDPRPALVLLALWLMVFSVSGQFLVLAPVLPRIAEQLGVPAERLGMLATGYALAVGSVALVAGPVSDRVGRRRMLLAGTAAMTVALALHGVARGYSAFLLARVLAGAGGGVLTGAAVAYVGDYFPYERRGWASGWVMSGMATGQILGVPVGALAAARFGFRSPFLLFAATMAAAWLLVWRFLPQPPLAPSREPLSPRGHLRHYAALLSRPAVAAAAGVYFATMLATALYTLYLPGWLEGARGAGAGQVAGVFMAGGVATLLAGPAAGRLSDRIGRRRVVISACAGAALLMLATPRAVPTVAAAYPLFFLLMALVAARTSPLDALLTAIVPAALRGSLMSLLMAAGQLGFGVGGALAGEVLGGHGFAGLTVLAAAAGLAAGALVWAFLPEPRPDTPSLAPAPAALPARDA